MQVQVVLVLEFLVAQSTLPAPMSPLLHALLKIKQRVVLQQDARVWHGEHASTIIH